MATDMIAGKREKICPIGKRLSRTLRAFSKRPEVAEGKP